MLDSSSESGVFMQDSHSTTRESPSLAMGLYSLLANRDLNGSIDPKYREDVKIVSLFLIVCSSFVLTVGVLLLIHWKMILVKMMALHYTITKFND